MTGGDWPEWSKFVIKSIERIENTLESLRLISEKAVREIYEKISDNKRDIDLSLEKINKKIERTEDKTTTKIETLEYRFDERLFKLEEKLKLDINSANSMIGNKINKLDDDLSGKKDEIIKNSIVVKVFTVIGTMIATLLLNYIYSQFVK